MWHKRNPHVKESLPLRLQDREDFRQFVELSEIEGKGAFKNKDTEELGPRYKTQAYRYAMISAYRGQILEAQKFQRFQELFDADPRSFVTTPEEGLERAEELQHLKLEVDILIERVAENFSGKTAGHVYRMCEAVLENPDGTGSEWAAACGISVANFHKMAERIRKICAKLPKPR